MAATAPPAKPMTAAMEAAARGPAVAKYDLTRTISQYLDLHLMFPLLEFVDEREIFQTSEVALARLDLLRHTHMVDYAMDIYKTLHNTEETPKEMNDQRAAVFLKLNKLKDDADRLTAVFADEALCTKLMQESKYSWEGLKNELMLADSTLDAYYDLAKFNFDCGDYGLAGESLAKYAQLTNDTTSSRGFGALWGRLACAILATQWDEALGLLREVKMAIEFKDGTPLQQMQQRSWLLHWSLFVFFNHANGRDELITMFFEDKFTQAIQANCPWLLRYLVTAIILTKVAANRRRNVMHDLIRVLEQEHESYSDPITEFLECLYVRFDFDGAQERLGECEKVLLSDFFLCGCAEEFMEEARIFIFETYCRIHHKINIHMLAEKMGMETEAAEKWIVDLIRGSQLDAKINSQESTVIMTAKYPTIYQQVIDKTKDLNIRSGMLINNLKQYATDLSNGVEPDPNDYESSFRGGGGDRGGRGGGRGGRGGGDRGGRGGGRGRGGGGY